MEVSGQLHAPAALTPGKQLPVPIAQENDWAQSISELYREEKNLLSLLGSNLDSSVVQPIA
jgi:cell shape-determining protein MreC